MTLNVYHWSIGVVRCSVALQNKVEINATLENLDKYSNRSRK